MAAPQELMCLIWNGESGDAARRYALKAISIAHQIGKSPIQIAIPNNSPNLLDLNMVRPTITLSIVLDKVVTNETVTGPLQGGGTTYKVPTKQDIEYFVTKHGYDDSSKLTLMLLHENNAYEQYEFAVQQFTTNLIPAKEDRYDGTLVVLVRNRAGTYNQQTDDAL